VKANNLLLITIVGPLLIGFSDSSISNFNSHVFFLVGVLITFTVFLLFEKGYNKSLLTIPHNNLNVYAIGRNYFITWSVLSIWIAWMYGVMMGVINGAELYSAVYNFSGIYGYILYFILLMIKPNPKFLVKIIYWTGYTYLAYSLGLLLYSLSTGYYDERIVASFNDVRILYSVSAICVLPIIGVKSWEIFVNKKLKLRTIHKYFNYLLPLIISTFLFIATFSKGFFLASITIIFWFFLLSLLNNFIDFKIAKSLFFNIILFTMVGALLFYTEININEIIIETISQDNLANATRTIQSRLLYDEFSFFGSGFGVKLNSGYIREDSGVQFELVYHNIVHKIGIMSLLVFLPIAVWVYISLKDSMRLGLRGYFGSFSLGLFAVLFVSLGNPVLFSLQSVIMQSIALYLLTQQQNVLNLQT
jgi:hypothetical protein